MTCVLLYVPGYLSINSHHRRPNFFANVPPVVARWAIARHVAPSTVRCTASATWNPVRRFVVVSTIRTGSTLVQQRTLHWTKVQFVRINEHIANDDVADVAAMHAGQDTRHVEYVVGGVGRQQSVSILSLDCPRLGWIVPVEKKN